MKTSERNEYLKDDLLIFSRYTSRNIVPIIAYKYIMPSKNYVFVGVLNKDKTKVKNILTGEVLPFSLGYANLGLTRYSYLTFEDINRIYNSYTSRNPIFPSDIYRCLNMQNLYELVFPQESKTISLKKLKKFVNQTNNEIHKTYKQLVNKGEIEYQNNKKIKEAKMSDKERDF